MEEIFLSEIEMISLKHKNLSLWANHLSLTYMKSGRFECKWSADEQVASSQAAEAELILFSLKPNFDAADYRKQLFNFYGFTYTFKCMSSIWVNFRTAYDNCLRVNK